MKNNTTIANFNVTFGYEEEPLLSHFEDCLYPALMSGIKRTVKKEDNIYDNYFFMNVRVEEIENEAVLIGQLVRETELVVKNKLVGDSLISTNERYPSAPYSVFCIFLRNHRMLLIRNQAGSPDIRSMGITVNYVLKEYREKVLMDSGVQLPYATVNVIGIPTVQTWEGIFKDAVKVKNVVLRFFPLNGDKNYSPIIENMSDLFFDNMKTKTAKISTGSCSNIDGVKDLVENLDGVVESTVIIDYPKRKNVKVQNNTMKEKTTFVGNEEEMNSADNIVPFGKDMDVIKKVSDDNNQIYETFLHIIRKFISK